MLAGLLDRTLAVVAVIDGETVQGVPCEWMVKRAADIRKFIEDGVAATPLVKRIYVYRNQYPAETYAFIRRVGVQYINLSQAFIALTAPKSYSDADKALLKELIGEANTALRSTEDAGDSSFEFLTNLRSLIKTMEVRAA